MFKVTTPLGFKRSQDDANVAAEALRKNFPDQEFEVKPDGSVNLIGQPGGEVDMPTVNRMKGLVQDYPAGGAIEGFDEALTPGRAAPQESTVQPGVRPEPKSPAPLRPLPVQA